MNLLIYKSGFWNLSKKLLFLSIFTFISFSAWTSELHNAVKEGNYKRVKKLIANGADVNALDADSRVALSYTRSILMSKLLSEVADFPGGGKCDQTKLSPLHIAVLEDDYKKVKKLIANGADVHKQSICGWTPLFFSRSPEVAGLLLENGAEFRKKVGHYDAYHYWIYPLHTAVLWLDFKRVKELLANGADVNEKSGWAGWTPLHLVWSSPEMAELLIANGADVHAKDRRNRTPLHYVYDYWMWWGVPAVMQVLLENGADPIIDSKKVEKLLEYGTDPHLKNKWIEKNMDWKTHRKPSFWK